MVAIEAKIPNTTYVSSDFCCVGFSKFTTYPTGGDTNVLMPSVMGRLSIVTSDEGYIKVERSIGATTHDWTVPWSLIPSLDSVLNEL